GFAMGSFAICAGFFCLLGFRLPAAIASPPIRCGRRGAGLRWTQRVGARCGVCCVSTLGIDGDLYYHR
ncbi:hypothetical protein P1N98_16275, partial [Tsukamurella tyrosinosolvens]|uniref:hypothetical protein n=1 Tax=Tsukamurella tyrosinosolvens TaxID=57704 RepID=UPI0024817135